MAVSILPSLLRRPLCALFVLLTFTASVSISLSATTSQPQPQPTPAPSPLQPISFTLEPKNTDLELLSPAAYRWKNTGAASIA